MAAFWCSSHSPSSLGLCHNVAKTTSQNGCTKNLHLNGEMGMNGQFTGQVQCPGHRPIKIKNNPHDDVVDRGAAVVRGELPQQNPWQRTRPGPMSWTAVFRNAFAIIFAFPITVAQGAQHHAAQGRCPEAVSSSTITSRSVAFKLQFDTCLQQLWRASRRGAIKDDVQDGRR